MIRFHSVAATLRDAVVAGDAYSDQSHLIREFREFSGMTPGHFLRRPDSLTGLFLG